MGEVIRDVSDHKHLEENLAQSEAYFRALIENSLDLIVVLDKAGITRFQSPSSERILGFRPEELVGQSVFAFVRPDDLGASRQAAQQVRVFFHFSYIDGHVAPDTRAVFLAHRLEPPVAHLADGANQDLHD